MRAGVCNREGNCEYKTKILNAHICLKDLSSLCSDRALYTILWEDGEIKEDKKKT